VSEIEIDYAILKTADDLPQPEEVRDLYATAATEPPLNETPQTAQVFADLYATALARNDVVGVCARQQGRLVAFAYGHPWTWEEQRDEWGENLKTRLGEQASAIDDTIALFLLARDPSVQRRGLGRGVLMEWLEAVRDQPTWLQTTDIDTPAQRLYRSVGYKEIGHGPEAPNNAPSLVMLRPRQAVRPRANTA
jgi:ribosomal protein S18 acetylase RimI-like enzyme